MTIETTTIPASNTNFSDTREVAKLIDRVRNQPMEIKYVTKGVPRTRATNRKRLRLFRALRRNWLALVGL